MDQKAISAHLHQLYLSLSIIGIGLASAPVYIRLVLSFK